MRRFVQFGIICTILKIVKNTHRGVLLLVLNVALLHGFFSRFLNCANGIKLRRAPHIYYVSCTYIIRTIWGKLKLDETTCFLFHYWGPLLLEEKGLQLINKRVFSKFWVLIKYFDEGIFNLQPSPKIRGLLRCNSIKMRSQIPTKNLKEDFLQDEFATNSYGKKLLRMRCFFCGNRQTAHTWGLF